MNLNQERLCLLLWSALVVGCGPGLRYTQPPESHRLKSPRSAGDHSMVGKESGPPDQVPRLDTPQPSMEVALVSDPRGAVVLEEATAAESLGDLIESRRLLLRLARSAPGSMEGQEAALRLAEEAVGRQDWSEAVQWGERTRLIERDREGLRRRALTMAIAYEGQGSYEAAVAAWRQVTETAEGEPLPEVVGGHARALLLSHRMAEALHLLDPHPVDTVLADEVLSGARVRETLEALSFDEGSLGRWGGWLMLQKARRLCDLGQLSGCRDAALRAATSPDPEVVQGAHGLLERVRLWDNADPRRLGLLVPLSTTTGRRARDAVELALGDHPEIELVVLDSGGRPESAGLALRDLVLTHRVVGVLGPLGPRETRGAAAEAARWSIPLLSLSRTPDPVSASHGAWRVRLSPGDQATALARHAVLEQGLRRVALVYPPGTYGEHFMSAFWDELVRLGGEVRAAQTYEPAMSSAEVEALVKRLVDAGEKGRSADQDFEALLLVGRGRAGKRRAEDLRSLKDILSHVRSQGMRIRTSPQAVGRPPPIQTLGDGTWNDRRSIDMGEFLTDNALFVDGYLDDDNQRERQRFRSRIYARTSRPPDAFDAITYDVANLLATELERLDDSGHDARLSLREALTQIRGFPGVTGQISLLRDGAVGRKAIMLTIDGEEIRVRRSEKEETALRTERGHGGRH